MYGMLIHLYYAIPVTVSEINKESLKIPKTYSEAVIRRSTDNTMQQEKKNPKRTSNNLQNTTKKTKHKLYIKLGQGRKVTHVLRMVTSSCSTIGTINFCFIRITSIFGTRLM